MIKNLPWKIVEDGDDYAVYDCNGGLVASDTPYYPTAPIKDDMAEIVRLISDVESRGKSIMALENENERLREGLQAAGISLFTASIVLTKLNHPEESETFSRAAKQAANTLNELKN